MPLIFHGTTGISGVQVFAPGTVGTTQLADASITGAKLENSGVTAGTLGSASAIPVVTVDAKGRVTGLTTTPLAASIPGILGQLFTASGTFTVPAGVTALKVTVVGGGGGGGSGCATIDEFNNIIPGNGGMGGAGGCGFKYITGLTPGSTISFTAGSGGSGGGPGANGGSGGTTSFGNYATATGGSGGATSTASGGGGAAGLVGSATVSDCVMLAITSYNAFGLGGVFVLNSNGAPPAQGFGGGASGGYSAQNAVWRTGGVGKYGLVLVEW